MLIGMSRFKAILGMILTFERIALGNYERRNMIYDISTSAPSLHVQITAVQVAAYKYQLSRCSNQFGTVNNDVSNVSNWSLASSWRGGVKVR